MNDTRYHLDHLMVCVADPTRAVQGLLDFGLLQSQSGLRRGTGAGATYFFFDDFYVEVAWEPGGQPAFQDAPAMHFSERVHGGWYPFGVSFRPCGPIAGGLPMSTWDYQASFLPPTATPIPIATNSPLPNEPLIIASLVSGRPDARVPRPPLQRHLGLREATKLTLHMEPPGPGSLELQRLRDIVPVAFVFEGPPHVDVEFDGGSRGRRHAFPGLPLSFSW